MFSLTRNVTVECDERRKVPMSNPLEKNSSMEENLSQMVNQIIEEEFPSLKNTEMLYDMVLYSLLERLNTIQTMENVLSYIREANIKKVDEILFKNGDINIKCSI